MHSTNNNTNWIIPQIEYNPSLIRPISIHQHIERSLMHLYSPSFNFPVLSYQSTNPPAQIPSSLSGIRSCLEQQLLGLSFAILWIGLIKILQYADKTPKAFCITPLRWKLNIALLVCPGKVRYATTTTVMKMLCLLLGNREPFHLLNFSPSYQPQVDALSFWKQSSHFWVSGYNTVIIRTITANVKIHENITDIKNS